MLWPNRHRRFIDQLSAYIDGELSPVKTGDLEGHLASCPDCRRHLEELHSTVLALSDLPQEDVPRSFALTPQEVARPVGPSRRRPATASTAMQMAGAALAVALAVVLVVDLGGIGGGGGQEVAPQALPGLTASEQANFDATSRAAVPVQPYGEASPPAVAPGDESAPGGQGFGGTVAGGGLSQVTPAPGASELPQPTAGPGAATTSPAPPVFSPTGVAERVAAAPQATLAAAGQPRAEGGGGLDGLRAAEIALALALGLAVAGIVALAFVGKKE